MRGDRRAHKPHYQDPDPLLMVLGTFLTGAMFGAVVVLAVQAIS